MKKIIIAVAAATLSAAGAIAQTTAPANPPPPATTTMPPATAPRTTATTAAKIRDVKMVLASDVVKSDVYDPQENKIGTIADVVMGRDGAPAQAVIGVGGFLGMGEKDVAIPFNDLKIKERDGKRWFELAQTKDQLKAATAFDLKAHKLM